MNDSIDARELITRTTKNDKTNIFQLKQELGISLLRPIIGLPDGFFVLDLAHESSRLALTRLLEISQTHAHLTGVRSPVSYRRFGDVSQKGNFSCFRNELFNDEPITLSTNTFPVIPKSGRLCFDFMSSCREGYLSHRPISDARVIRALTYCRLLGSKTTCIDRAVSGLGSLSPGSHSLKSPVMGGPGPGPGGIQTHIVRRRTYSPAAVIKQTDIDDALECLASMKHECDQLLNFDGTVLYRVNKQTAREISLYRDYFYENLSERQRELDAATRNEIIRVLSTAGSNADDLFNNDDHSQSSSAHAASDTKGDKKGKAGKNGGKKGDGKGGDKNKKAAAGASKKAGGGDKEKHKQGGNKRNSKSPSSANNNNGNGNGGGSHPGSPIMFEDMFGSGPNSLLSSSAATARLGLGWEVYVCMCVFVCACVCRESCFISNVDMKTCLQLCCYVCLSVYRSGEDGAMDPTQALLSDSELGVPAAVSVDIDQMPEFKLEQSNTSHPEVCLFLCMCVCMRDCVCVLDLQYF
jgi:hypothetical protein